MPTGMPNIEISEELVMRNNARGVQRFGNDVRVIENLKLQLRAIKRDMPFRIIEESLKKQAMNTNQDQGFEETVQNIFRLLGIKNIEVMISINGKFDNGSCFSKIMTVEEFLAYDGDFKLYVAQYSIYNRLTYSSFFNISDKKGLGIKLRKDNSHRLGVFFRNFLAPAVVGERLADLRTVNLWINLQVSTSKLHFDLYDNVLYVVRGRKTIYLLPPGCEAVKSKVDSLISFHEGRVAKGYLRGQKKGVKVFVRSRDRYRELWKVGMRKCVLREGDAIRIPEGWYHFVISEPKTIAFNFWFKSVLEDIEPKKQPILTYLIQQEIDNKIHRTEEKSVEETKWKNIPNTLFRLELLKDLISGKLNFKELLSQNDSYSVPNAKKLKVDYILRRLSELDNKQNADLYTRLSSRGTLSNCLTDPFKERFYEIFCHFFDDSTRLSALDNSTAIRRYLGKRSIDDLISYTDT